MFYDEDGETLEQVAQRGGACPADIQCQTGWGFEQPDLVEDVHLHCVGVGLDILQKDPANPEYSTNLCMITISVYILWWHMLQFWQFLSTEKLRNVRL